MSCFFYSSICSRQAMTYEEVAGCFPLDKMLPHLLAPMQPPQERQHPSKLPGSLPHPSAAKAPLSFSRSSHRCGAGRSAALEHRPSAAATPLPDTSHRRGRAGVSPGRSEQSRCLSLSSRSRLFGLSSAELPASC